MENDTTTKRVVVTTTIDAKTKKASRSKTGAPRITKSIPETTTIESTTTMAPSTPEATTTHKKKEEAVAQTGGAAPQKVILTKKKKATKVILGTTKMVVPKQKSKTMKHIKLNTKGITRRIKRAKLITKTLAAKSLDTIKKELVEAKLVKADTKAPESVLRQIHTDYMLMKGKAL